MFSNSKDMRDHTLYQCMIGLNDPFNLCRYLLIGTCGSIKETSQTLSLRNKGQGQLSRFCVKIGIGLADGCVLLICKSQPFPHAPIIGILSLRIQSAGDIKRHHSRNTSKNQSPYEFNI